MLMLFFITLFGIVSDTLRRIHLIAFYWLTNIAVSQNEKNSVVIYNNDNKILGILRFRKNCCYKKETRIKKKRNKEK
jgi:hypothetical protein